MTKKEAIGIFGGSGVALARALGITKSAVSQWPEVLSQRTADEVIGAALRLGRIAHSTSDNERAELRPDLFDTAPTTQKPENEEAA